MLRLRAGSKPLKFQWIVVIISGKGMKTAIVENDGGPAPGWRSFSPKPTFQPRSLLSQPGIADRDRDDSYSQLFWLASPVENVTSGNSITTLSRTRTRKHDVQNSHG